MELFPYQHTIYLFSILKPLGSPKGIKSKMGSVVIPIQQHEIVEFLFEISEKIPNNVYIDIMNLMKKYHECECNLTEVNNYILSNKNIIEYSIFNNLIHLLKPPPLKKLYFKCSCERNFYCLSKYILFLITCFCFLGTMVWVIVKK